LAVTNVAFDDHPNEKSFADRFEILTVGSAFAWRRRSGLSTAAVFLNP